jgi:hypothetical protein
MTKKDVTPGASESIDGWVHIVDDPSQGKKHVTLQHDKSGMAFPANWMNSILEHFQGYKVELTLTVLDLPEGRNLNCRGCEHFNTSDGQKGTCTFDISGDNSRQKKTFAGISCKCFCPIPDDKGEKKMKKARSEQSGRFQKEYPDEKFIKSVNSRTQATAKDVAADVGCNERIARDRLNEIAARENSPIIKKVIGTTNHYMPTKSVFGTAFM